MSSLLPGGLHATPSQWPHTPVNLGAAARAGHSTAEESGAAAPVVDNPWNLVETRLKEVSAKVEYIRASRAAARAGTQAPQQREAVVRTTPPHLVFAPGPVDTNSIVAPPPPSFEGASAPPLPGAVFTAAVHTGSTYSSQPATHRDDDFAAALSTAERVISRVTAGLQ